MHLRVLAMLAAALLLRSVLPAATRWQGCPSPAAQSNVDLDGSDCVARRAQRAANPSAAGAMRHGAAVGGACLASTAREQQLAAAAVQQQPSAHGLLPLCAAIAALAAALISCCAHMLQLKWQVRHLLQAAGTDNKVAPTLPPSISAACAASCCGSSREDSTMLGSPSFSNEVPVGFDRLCRSSKRGSAEGQPTAPAGEPAPQPPASERLAFTSPFQVAPACRQAFSQTNSLSPPASTSPHATLSSPRDPLISSRPPRIPYRCEGISARAAPPLACFGSPPPPPLYGRRSGGVDSSKGLAAATTAPHGGPHPVVGLSLLTLNASGCMNGLLEEAVGGGETCSRASASLSASTATSSSNLVLLKSEELGLPMRLIQCLVDPAAVEYLHGPDGCLEQLGAGASSRVYKALYNGDVIAAKEIDIGHNLEMRQSFVTEALLLQHLRHPHVIGFFGLSLTADKGVMLLEYAEGRDLHSALQRTSPGSNERLFGWRRRGRRVAYEVAKALNYLHSKGVTHMDIKSANVLLTASGEARLSDVGLSRHQALDRGSTATDARCIGTFAWMAPELLLDADGSCTTACDIYSYGVLLWEVLTGERPLRGRLRAPRVPEECPAEVADLAMRCLAKEPSNRPTAGQLLQELGMLLLKRAFSTDRTTTNLLGSRAGSSAAPEIKRASADGMPLRTMRLEPAPGGFRRSISFDCYPLLATAAQGFDQPTAAARLGAALPQSELVGA